MPSCDKPAATSPKRVLGGGELPEFPSTAVHNVFGKGAGRALATATGCIQRYLLDLFEIDRIYRADEALLAYALAIPPTSFASHRALIMRADSTPGTLFWGLRHTAQRQNQRFTTVTAKAGSQSADRHGLTRHLALHRQGITQQGDVGALADLGDFDGPIFAGGQSCRIERHRCDRVVTPLIALNAAACSPCAAMTTWHGTES